MMRRIGRKLSREWPAILIACSGLVDPIQPRMCSMRRSLVFFMLLLVQMQFVWGGAASYCAHETGSAAVVSHFGHHEHRHTGEAPEDTATDQENNGLGLPHPDCESCHLGATGILLPVPAFHAEMGQGEFLKALNPIFVSHVSPTPERPDRITREAAV